MAPWRTIISPLSATFSILPFCNFMPGCVVWASAFCGENRSLRMGILSSMATLSIRARQINRVFPYRNRLRTLPDE